MDSLTVTMFTVVVVLVIGPMPTHYTAVMGAADPAGRHRGLTNRTPLHHPARRVMVVAELLAAVDFHSRRGFGKEDRRRRLEEARHDPRGLRVPAHDGFKIGELALPRMRRRRTIVARRDAGHLRQDRILRPPAGD
jgi:hypothetical protein